MLTLFPSACPWGSGHSTTHRWFPRVGGSSCICYVQPNTQHTPALQLQAHQLGCSSSHMPAADSPSKWTHFCKHPQGFAFRFPSALHCVIKPPDSPLLTKTFCNTKSKPQTCHAAKKTEQTGPLPGWGLGLWNQEWFSLRFIEIRNKKWCSCSAPPLWILCSLHRALLFWPVSRPFTDSTAALTAAAEPQGHKTLVFSFSISLISMPALQFRHAFTTIQRGSLKIKCFGHLPRLLSRNTTVPSTHQISSRKIKAITGSLNGARTGRSCSCLQWWYGCKKKIWSGKASKDFERMTLKTTEQHQPRPLIFRSLINTLYCS